MKRVNVPQSPGKGHALDAIFYTLRNFAELLYNVDIQPELTAGSELSKVSQLVSDKGYQEALENIDWTIFGNLSTEGFEEFLLKCKALSDAYDLGINIPVDVRVIGQEIVDEFYQDLKQKALETILENKSQADVFKKQLTEQVSKIDFKDDENTYLESILQAKQKYNEAKIEFDKAQSEIVALASSHEFAGYDPLYARLNASKDKMDMLLKENPLIIFLKGKTDSEVVLKEIISLTNKIEKSLDKLNKKISEDTYPLWELTPLVSFVLNQDKYQNHRELILYDIEKKKSDKYKKELFITIGTIVLATATLLIPGGCCFGLLLAKAVTAAAGTALSIAQSTKDFIEAGELKDLAYANVLSTDQIKLVDDADVTKATRNYILSGAFLFLGIFDVADSTKTVMLIRKFDKLDDAAKLVLKSSKSFGKKAFHDLSVERLNALDDYFLTFFNNNGDNIVKMYQKIPAEVICKSPDDLLIKYTNTFKRFDEFAATVGKEFAGSIDDKVRIIQQSFENLSSGQRHLLTIPDNALYVKGFGPRGHIEYLWPDNMGIKVGSDISVISTKGNVDLPDELYRVGSYWGNNFSDAVYSYDELAIPYRDNSEALTVFKIRKESYIKKIDALANGNMDELNKILQREGVAKIDVIDFDALSQRYKNIQRNFIKEKMINCNTKYGIKGTVAEWYNPKDKSVKWFNGGAPQFITPLNVNDMKTLGIITEIK